LLLFNDALNFAGKVASKKGKVLFVGTKRAAGNVMKEQAERCGMPYVNHRWLGGMMTNFKTVKQSIKRLKDLEKSFEDGSTASLSKKEALTLSREKEKLEKTLGGIKDMGALPSALFVVDVGYEKIAVLEAAKIGIPVIGVVDTNNSIKNIDYIIPGNDDAMRAITLYAESMADAILDAKSSITTAPIVEETAEVPAE
jgi:small subunit ribosomal protein S2